MDTNEQLTSEEAELVKALSLVPAVAELSGVSYRVAYNLIHGVGLSKPHPRAFAVVQIARQLVATTQALREKKIRRKRSSNRPKLYQVYDLIGLKEDLWSGDVLLVAQMTGVSRRSIYRHLSGAATPYKGICKLAWRVLLAKIERNRTFTRVWQNADKDTVSAEAFSAAASGLLPYDAIGLGHLLGRAKGHCAYWIEKAGIEALPPHLVPLAVAVVARAECNRQFLRQVHPWLQGKNGISRI